MFFEPEALSDNELIEVLNLVHRFTGITMNLTKKNLIQSRMRPRLRALGIKTYADYISYLKNNKSEHQHFIDLCTTNETYFFRTTRVWEYFLKEYLPKWHSQNKNKTLSVWSAASSSGEEVYSIGIACESFKRINNDFNYEILGTDISQEILDKAVQGKYIGRSIEYFKNTYPKLFNEFLKTNEDETKSVLDEIRQRINFEQHNLFHSPKKNNYYDIVFLRNVLIYFTRNDQEKVLAQIRNSIKEDGELIIGESESITNLDVNFGFKQPLIYKKAS